MSQSSSYPLGESLPLLAIPGGSLSQSVPRPQGRIRALGGFAILGLALWGRAALADLPEGLYAQGCQGAFQRAEEIHGLSAVFVERNFSDAACGQPTLTVRSYGQLRFGEALPTPAGASALDFFFLRITLTPESEEVARYYRDRQLCGLKQWTNEREQEITARKCDFFGLGTPLRSPARGAARYGIYHQNSDGSLSFGALSPEANGLAPETRPVLWDPRPYLFQAEH